MIQSGPDKDKGIGNIKIAGCAGVLTGTRKGERIDPRRQDNQVGAGQAVRFFDGGAERAKGQDKGGVNNEVGHAKAVARGEIVDIVGGIDGEGCRLRRMNGKDQQQRGKKAERPRAGARP